MNQVKQLPQVKSDPQLTFSLGLPNHWLKMKNEKWKSHYTKISWPNKTTWPHEHLEKTPNNREQPICSCKNAKPKMNVIWLQDNILSQIIVQNCSFYEFRVTKHWFTPKKIVVCNFQVVLEPDLAISILLTFLAIIQWFTLWWVSKEKKHKHTRPYVGWPHAQALAHALHCSECS